MALAASDGRARRGKEAFSAALAAWFLTPENEATDAEIAAMREELQKLREAVERLTK